nr:type II toxin-antitoxin system VapC family toxin [uncultured Methanospirillum sp.]
MGITDSILGDRIYLDTNIFIYALEAFPEYLELIQSLFSSIDSGKYKAVTSELTLAEVLVKPLIDHNAELEYVYQSTIQSSDSIDVIPISRDILIEAAKNRAGSPSIHLPDAIHAATARLHQCSSFITNDKRLASLSGIQVIILSNYTR